MIDLHTHVLPGIDDGPADTAGAVALARAAVAGGTTVMAATPHIDFEFGLDPLDIPPLVDELRAVLEREDIPLRVERGGELALTRAGALDDRRLEAIRLGGGPYLLLECPFTPNASVLEPVMFELQSRGHQILLGHPERAPAIQRDRDLLVRLIERGALVQITSSSLRGSFGTTVKRFSLDLVREGLVHVLASDAHEVRRRGPELAGALTAAADELGDLGDLGRWLTYDAPRAILDGTPLPERPPPPERPRRLRLRLRR